MGERLKPRMRRRSRVSIAALMLAIAGLAVIFAMIRRNVPEAVATRMAAATLIRYEPDFRPDEHRADKIARVGNYWHVHFQRIKGSGEAGTSAFVHDWGVQEARRHFWEPRANHPLFGRVDACGQVCGVTESGEVATPPPSRSTSSPAATAQAGWAANPRNGATSP